MKSISAAIVVVAAAVLLVGGASIGDDGTAIQAVGWVVGIIALSLWWMTLRMPDAIDASRPTKKDHGANC